MLHCGRTHAHMHNHAFSPSLLLSFTHLADEAALSGDRAEPRFGISTLATQFVQEGLRPLAGPGLQITIHLKRKGGRGGRQTTNRDEYVGLRQSVRAKSEGVQRNHQSLSHTCTPTHTHTHTHTLTPWRLTEIGFGPESSCCGGSGSDPQMAKPPASPSSLGFALLELLCLLELELALVEPRVEWALEGLADVPVVAVNTMQARYNAEPTMQSNASN